MALWGAAGAHLATHKVTMMSDGGWHDGNTSAERTLRDQCTLSVSASPLTDLLDAEPELSLKPERSEREKRSYRGYTGRHICTV